MIADNFDANWKRNRNGCHIWQRAQAGKYAKFGRGYGCFRLNGKLAKAHVFSYERAYGPVPKGLHVLHSCDDPRCVNPAHLSVGTNADNMRQRLERDNYRIKLTARKVLAIRKAHAEGVSQRQLGFRYGIANQTVNEIVHREIWRHV